MRRRQVIVLIPSGSMTIKSDGDCMAMAERFKADNFSNFPAAFIDCVDIVVNLKFFQEVVVLDVLG